MKDCVILQLLMYFLLFPPFHHSAVIHVDWEHGENNVSCLHQPETTDISCKTLDYACENLQSDTRIILHSGLHILGRGVGLSRVNNISIVGTNDSIVNCSSINVGVKFVHVVGLFISSIQFQHCGVLQDSTSISSTNGSITVAFRSAFYFLNSTDITISTVNFINNTGVAVTMYDTGGHVIIENIQFSYNKVPDYDSLIHPGGGGLYIEFTNCTPGQVENCALNPFVRSNQYKLINCSFIDNHGTNLPNSTTTFLNKHTPSWQRFGFGGGLSIAMKGESSNNSFIIDNCTFINNKGLVGGGMSLMIDDLSKNNTFKIVNSRFWYNHAQHGGGGIEFGFFSPKVTCDTTIIFNNCHFLHNSAVYGGAVAFYSSRAEYTSVTKNYVTFEVCSWHYNEAVVGAAIVLFPQDWVSISSGYLPDLHLYNCIFTRNTISYFQEKDTDHITSTVSVNGAIIYSDTFSLYFSGNTSFFSNRGSSICITVGEVNVLEEARMEFVRNTARRGGALSLVDHASVVAYKNSKITFQNNSALELGGAIYYVSNNYLDFINSRRCFLRYHEISPVNEWVTEFIFINNQARNYGHSIYATSLEACARASVTNISTPYNISTVFHWKPFTFFPQLGSEDHIITTDPLQFSLNSNYIESAPGIVTDLKLKVKDGLGQPLNTVLYASCDSECSDGNVSILYRYVSDNKIMFNGRENKSITVNLETTTSRPSHTRVNVKLTFCPPGYFFNGDSCQCSVSTSHELPGIVGCDDHKGQAKMQLGYWAGCVAAGERRQTLATGQCPLGYCSYTSGKNQSEKIILLPGNCNALGESMCKDNNRQGWLCGECIDGYSVYFHSDRFKCGNCSHPELGIPFYILSELLPLTILFAVIIIFDISFTSGVVGSFIFFAQVLDFFDVTAFGSYNLPYWMLFLLNMYKFIFGCLNLDFFKLDVLSFCLWGKTTVLDVLVFKYMTTLFGLALIALLILLMKFCSFTILRYFRKNKYGGYTVTNGLTAFIIITYSQCAKVSFEILNRFRLSVDTSDFNSGYYDVVFLSGNTPFFGRNHLKYALPAVLCIVYITLVPILLILQPVYFSCKRWSPLKFQTVSQVMERWNCHLSCQKLTLAVKPLMDSFQSVFKDEMRIFAGFYFLYRLAIAASFAFSVTAVLMYTLLEVILITILAVHSIFQPYLNRKHNITDSLIYADLALINGISLYNFIAKQYHFDGQNYTELLVGIQLVLIYLPVISIFGLLLVKLTNCFCLNGKTNDRDVHFDTDSLPYRMFENNSSP